ncbi:hypothetical protein BDF21DRAFT_426176 [Thamnidium elegans]|nr:hypothetical protein BDF21DRAFT_426176 [Thamnidium elegans]
MKKEINRTVKHNAFKHDLKADRPRTRASIKQEPDDSKESLKCALYSPVKIDTPSLETDECESSSSTETLRSLPKGVKNRHCSICNIDFWSRVGYLDHELHSHKTKETPVIDLVTLRCNICNKMYTSSWMYRLHMASRNNIHVPPLRSNSKPGPDPSKIPDANDPNNYCISCNFKFKSRASYTSHLVRSHGMSHVITPKKPRKLRSTDLTIDILNRYCDFCDKTYSSKSNYIYHLVHTHRMTLPNIYSEQSNFDHENFYCKMCDRRYQKKKTFITHLRNVHCTEPPPSCPVPIPDVYDKNNYCVACDITLIKRKNYLHHLTSVHLDKIPELFQGIDCAKPSNTEILYKKYCTDCRKVFLLKRLCQIHMDKIHDIKPLRTLSTINDPDIDDPNNHCSLCNRTYTGKSIYRQHLAKVHHFVITPLPRGPAIRTETPIVDELNMYCNVCDKTFNKLSDYRSHLYRSHGIKRSRSKLPKICNRTEKPVIDEINNHCTACDKVYKNRSSYLNHLYKIHNVTVPKKRTLPVNHDIVPDWTNENNYCAACNRTYTGISAYRNHLARIHDMKKLKIEQDTYE